ncbi:MAG: SUMF1/EgtB/PvdO family nonheme iron enzyme [Bacteroidota bacterium]
MNGSNRVLRGGSWNNDATNLRVSNRNNNDPSNRNNNNGFRPANTGYCPLCGLYVGYNCTRACPAIGPAPKGQKLLVPGCLSRAKARKSMGGFLWIYLST